MPVTEQKLLLIGCGKMGGAILRGVSAAQMASEVVVIEPSVQPDDLKQIPNLLWKNSVEEVATTYSPHVILIAVKPQVIAEVLPVYARYKTAVFLSIAAGISLQKLTHILKNSSAAIVRTMPNLPASIGQGMTVAIANVHASDQQKNICDGILRATGATTWIDNEGLMDAVTALSGSGPAYVFALCEAMAAAGEKLGLTQEMAAKLARQTVVGSAALLAQSLEGAEALRRAVTSPKGTTEAALTHLLGEHGLHELLLTSMAAATKRSKELAQ